MGGRGRAFEIGAQQLTIEDIKKQNKISEIIKKSNLKRNAKGSDVGGIGSPMLLKKCACCGEYTIPIRSENEICLICGWIDDKYQNKNPASLNGKNPIALAEAQVTYREKKQ